MAKNKGWSEDHTSAVAHALVLAQYFQFYAVGPVTSCGRNLRPTSSYKGYTLTQSSYCVCAGDHGWSTPTLQR
jgi:hypothetical protein